MQRWLLTLFQGRAMPLSRHAGLCLWPLYRRADGLVSLHAAMHSPVKWLHFAVGPLATCLSMSSPQPSSLNAGGICARKTVHNFQITIDAFRVSRVLKGRPAQAPIISIKYIRSTLVLLDVELALWGAITHAEGMRGPERAANMLHEPSSFSSLAGVQSAVCSCANIGISSSCVTIIARQCISVCRNQYAWDTIILAEWL